VQREAPVVAATSPYALTYRLDCLAAAGTLVFLAALLAFVPMLIAGVPPRTLVTTLGKTARQLKLPVITIAFILSIATVMNYSGMTSSMALALSKTGVMFPFFSALLGMIVVERIRPLRVAKGPGAKRVGRNLTIGLLAAATTAVSDLPIMTPAMQWAERRRFGLLRWMPLPRIVRVALGFLLLDYTLYLWHRLNHHVPQLWRFHAVHHIDLDLDTTTGLRFHFGE